MLMHPFKVYLSGVIHSRLCDVNEHFLGSDTVTVGLGTTLYMRLSSCIVYLEPPPHTFRVYASPCFHLLASLAKSQSVYLC